jgi:hypothetical protein
MRKDAGYWLLVPGYNQQQAYNSRYPASAYFILFFHASRIGLATKMEE